MRRHIKAMRRDTVIVSGVALISVAIGAVVFLSGYDSSAVINNQSPAVTVPFTTLTQGRQSTVARRVNYFITSPAQLSEIWEVINATGTPPKLDFKKQAVIVVFAGNESSSSIAVAKIEDTTKRMVSIAITKPDCTVPPSAESPYEIIAVPATSLPLAHSDIPTTINCPK